MAKKDKKSEQVVHATPVTVAPAKEADITDKNSDKKKKKKRKHQDDVPLKKHRASDGADIETQQPSKRERKESKRVDENDDINDKSSNGRRDCGVWKFAGNDAVSKEQADVFLQENHIHVNLLDGKVFDVRPILEFSQAAFPPKLEDALKSAFVAGKPTPIQAVSWPPVLAGRDLVGIAATGSGKTLSFGMPALISIQNQLATTPALAKRPKPLVLVLAPTRELAMQTYDQLSIFGTSIGIRSVCIYGGVSKYEQKQALRQGMHAIVATPGRLIDLFEEDAHLCDLSSVRFLVLDEADRMLDVGFEEAIKKIVARLPSPKDGRQTVMFSATWPLSIQKMAETYLSNPVRITVGSTKLTANVNIEQRVEVISPEAKEHRLLALLRDYHQSRKNRVLIFALYKNEANRLEQLIKRNGYKVGIIHGDLSQVQRTAAITGFKSGSCPLLIATDVAARGIDIPNVEYVLNVTFPLTIEDYCHRIGRTGRAGKTGISHTFFTSHDKAHSGTLINVLKRANQIVPPELLKFGTTVKKKLDPNYGAFAKEIDPTLKATKTTFDSDSDDE